MSDEALEQTPRSAGSLLAEVPPTRLSADLEALCIESAGKPLTVEEPRPGRCDAPPLTLAPVLLHPGAGFVDAIRDRRPAHVHPHRLCAEAMVAQVHSPKKHFRLHGW